MLGNTAKSYWETAQSRLFFLKDVPVTNNTIPSFRQFTQSLFAEQPYTGIQDEVALRNNLYNNFMPSRNALYDFAE